MIRTGRDANPGVGRPSNAGVTTINEARSKTDRTIAVRTHTSRSTSRPIERNDNKRSARGGSRLGLVRTEVQERRDAKQTGAHDSREEVRGRTVGRAEGEVSDRRIGERRGAEQSARQPEELSQARIERERRLLDVVRRRRGELMKPPEERANADEDRHIGGTQDVGGGRGLRGRRHGPHRPGPGAMYVPRRLSPLNITPRVRRASDGRGAKRSRRRRSSLRRTCHADSERG